MSKQVKSIAGCNLPSGERLGLRRVDDRVGPTLISTQLELHRGETVLATGLIDIETELHTLGLAADAKEWMLGNLREAVKAVRR